MLTDLETRPLPFRQPTAFARLAGSPVLLASDGSPASSAAARIAFQLASQLGAEVHVVNVMDSRSAPMPPPLDLLIGLTDAAVGEGVHAQQIDAVRAGLAEAVGGPVAWDVRMALGTPAQAIVKEARRLRSALIVIGLRRHGRLDRALQDETTLAVMRRAPCPVLGVAAGAAALPVKALAAVDFSLASLAAVRAARSVMGDHGMIVLAYAPSVSFHLPDDGEGVVHRLGVEAGFSRCRAELADAGIRTDQVILHHDETTVATALLQYADAAKCDLIAAGSARRGRLDRWILGSVSTDLVRNGRHSVLVVPPQRPRITIAQR